MARPLRLQFPGAIHHVTFRGIERRLIFRDDRDRIRILGTLEEMADRHKVRVYLVCLMANHVHLLLETPRGHLSAFMGQFLTSYTVYFNLRHRRVGHLTQGRYKAQVVAGDEYLLKLSRYIHLNPVHTKGTEELPTAERVKTLRSYRWSTYRSYAGLDRPWSWIEYGPVRAKIGKGDGSAAAYRGYVEAALAQSDDEFRELYDGARLAVGSEDFRREMEQRHTALGRTRSRREDVSFRRTLDRRKPDDILAGVARVFGVLPEELQRRRRNAAFRAAACWHLMTQCGLTQREVAKWVNLGSGVAVGYQMNRWKVLSQEKRYHAAAEKLRSEWEQP
ncbi:MAG: transposase [Verrucomicrobia bacterium]|nr:transposase [Verrucomicrobiota bacterium]